jgi:hypothetical protein
MSDKKLFIGLTQIQMMLRVLLDDYIDLYVCTIDKFSKII